MIKRNLIIFLFIIIYLCVYKVSANIYEKDLPLLGKVIYLDAGHGRYCYSTQRIKTIRTS